MCRNYANQLYASHAAAMWSIVASTTISQFFGIFVIPMKYMGFTVNFNGAAIRLSFFLRAVRVQF